MAQRGIPVGVAADDFAYSAQPTRNPFRYALAVWRLVRHDPAETTHEAAIVEIGFARSRIGRRFARWDDMLATLREQSGPADALRARRPATPIDLVSLEALPPGSLGRVFATHCRERNLDPNLIRVPEVDETGWMLNHLYQTHDVWHVLSGWDNDLPGEVGLGAFYMGQFRSPPFFGFMLALILMNVVWRRADLGAVMTAISEGYRTGRAADPLFGVTWSDWWETPVADVRRHFRIASPGEAAGGVEPARSLGVPSTAPHGLLPRTMAGVEPS
ncbi:MAG: Coq4 family protein [Myxococcota bacterium]|nr:Coq4 family protein [Myxococcota bacterium]